MPFKTSQYFIWQWNSHKKITMDPFRKILNRLKMLYIHVLRKKNYKMHVKLWIKPLLSKFNGVDIYLVAMLIIPITYQWTIIATNFVPNNKFHSIIFMPIVNDCNINLRNIYWTIKSKNHVRKGVNGINCKSWKLCLVFTFLFTLNDITNIVSTLHVYGLAVLIMIYSL